MMLRWCAILLFGSVLLASAPNDFNVNSRYTVESVEFDGDQFPRLSSGLRSEIQRMIGEKLNTASIEDLASRMRDEMSARTVTHRVARGSRPDHVKVVFEVARTPARFDLSVPKFLYHAKQGWSAAVEATGTVKGNSVSVGLISDGDELAERYAGLIGRYERPRAGSDRVGARIDFESYHQQWNQATLALAGDEIYRTRHNVQPVVSFKPARMLTLTAGASFQAIETQFPAARTEAANAVVTTLRYSRRMEGNGTSQNALDAGYSLRAATQVLGSDFVYARHRIAARYEFRHGRHQIIEDFAAGFVTGHAPLFERFVLGNSSTLRGWNKFDITPAGSTRMAHNSVEYRYRVLQVFYDTGAAWGRDEDPTPRHSVGAGLRYSIFSLALAFPLRDGRPEPVVMLGMNY